MTIEQRTERGRRKGKPGGDQRRESIMIVPMQILSLRVAAALLENPGQCDDSTLAGECILCFAILLNESSLTVRIRGDPGIAIFGPLLRAAKDIRAVKVHLSCVAAILTVVYRCGVSLVLMKVVVVLVFGLVRALKEAWVLDLGLLRVAIASLGSRATAYLSRMLTTRLRTLRARMRLQMALSAGCGASVLALSSGSAPEVVVRLLAGRLLIHLVALGGGDTSLADHVGDGSALAALLGVVVRLLLV